MPYTIFRGRGSSQPPGKSQQQVPHGAFGPVRNDRGLLGVDLRGAEGSALSGGVAAVESPAVLMQRQRQRTGVSVPHGRCFAPVGMTEFEFDPEYVGG